MILDENSPSKSIEMSGYRMMAYLFLYDVETDSGKKAMYLKKVETVKEWLLSKRKGNGLFESTQVLKKFICYCAQVQGS